MACVGAPRDVVEAARSGRFSSTSWVKYQSSTSISLEREFTSPDIYLTFESASAGPRCSLLPVTPNETERGTHLSVWSTVVAQTQV
jgi:hypothetical protein